MSHVFLPPYYSVFPKLECPTSFLPIKHKLLHVALLGFPPDTSSPFSHSYCPCCFVHISVIYGPCSWLWASFVHFTLLYISSSSLCVVHKCLLNHIQNSNWSISTLALLVGSCVILSYLTHLSKSQFPPLKNGDHNSTHLRISTKDEIR